MKAITLTQPWATLVACGEKRIETRSWYTHYRGPIAIHAAQRFPSWAQDFARACDPCREALKRQLTSRNIGGDKWPHYLPLGAVVGFAVLEAVGPTETIFDVSRAWSPPLDTPQERSLGDYTPGRYAWLLNHIVPLVPPIEAKGARGLWDWTPPDSLLAWLADWRRSMAA